MEIQRQPSISSTLKILAKEFEEPRDDQTLVSGEISLKRKHSDCAFPSSMLSKRRFSNHSNMSKAAVGLRELAKKIGEAPLKWEGDKPKHVMIVSKPRDDSLTLVAADIASALAGMGLTVHVQNTVMEHYSTLPTVKTETLSTRSSIILWEDNEPSSSDIDFVITLGGDGTVLYACWLFQQRAPPVVPFNLGSLGFLTVFALFEFEDVLKHLLANDDGMRMSFRMRFNCTIHRAMDKEGNRETDHLSSYQVLNELCVDRGPSPFLSQLELFGNGCHLTTVQADGLVISTPTGSTAYSLSAGGSVVHPDVSAVMVTPICPHTLSFRPMILPDTMEIRILVPEHSRATAWVSFDGRHRVNLLAGDSIQIESSQYPVPTLCKVNQSEDWFHGLETCLAWNKREKQKPLD